MQVVGVDVGGTKIRAAVARSPEFVLESEHEVATDPAGGEVVARQIIDVVRRVAGDRFADVEAVGVGTPGAVDPSTGRTRLSQNIAGLDAFDLPGLLEHELERPVRVENDANLAAVAECWRGGAAGLRDCAVVSVGTGIGGGLVSNGVLVRGARGGAGELADLPLVGDPFDRVEQVAGVFEGHVGTAGLVRRYHRAGGPSVATAREVFRAADEGDEAAQTVIAEVGRDVALGIVAITAMVDPRLVVLSGGIGAQPRFLRAVEAALPQATSRPVDIVVSPLGDRAGLLGAVGLAAGVLDQQGRLTGSAFPARRTSAGPPPAATWYEREVREQPGVIARLVEEAPARLGAWVAHVPGDLPLLLLARGTSDHVATYGRYLLAQLAGRDALLAIPSLTTVHDRDPARRAAVVAISQSGRSPDLVHVMERGASRGWPTLAIVNDVGSPLAAAAGTVLDLRCGPERAVAATKSYSASLAALAVLATEAGPIDARERRHAELRALPDRIDDALATPVPERAVAVLGRADRVLVTGRGVNLATAQELGLKLQETTGIMAQAWSPADLLHGPVAAAGPDTPLVAILPPGSRDRSVLDACGHARDRGGEVVMLGALPTAMPPGAAPTTVAVATPHGVAEWLSPLTSIVVAQRLVGAVAAWRGADVDHPPGLRKVTETT